MNDLDSEKRDLVECLEENKRFSYALDATQGVISDIGFLENGNLVLLEILNTKNENYTVQGFLKITTLNKLREKVADTYLQYTPAEHEKTFYELTWNSLVPSSVSTAYEITPSFSQPTFTKKTLIPFRTSEQTSIKISGNNLYVMAHSYFGLHLYYYDINLELDWAQQVMPMYDSLLSWNVRSAFSVDERGYIYVATGLVRQVALVWENHFDEHINGEINESEILVMSYDEQGNYLTNHMVGSNDVLILADISVDSERILVSSSNRIKKLTDASGSTEWDLVLTELSLDLALSPNYSVLNFDQEDSIAGHLPLENNELLVWGSNGYRQVDTNSQVSNGKGFIKKIMLIPGKTAEITADVSYLDGPRDVGISAVLKIEGGKLLVAGSFDGPITHTAADSLYQKVMVGTYQLQN
jgi:hypothetical protein